MLIKIFLAIIAALAVIGGGILIHHLIAEHSEES